MEKSIAEQFVKNLLDLEQEKWLNLLKHIFINTSQVLKILGTDIIKFDSMQLEKIRHGLSINDIKSYAKSKQLDKINKKDKYKRMSTKQLLLDLQVTI